MIEPLLWLYGLTCVMMALWGLDICLKYWRSIRMSTLMEFQSIVLLFRIKRLIEKTKEGPSERRTNELASVYNDLNNFFAALGREGMAANKPKDE